MRRKFIFFCFFNFKKIILFCILYLFVQVLVAQNVGFGNLMVDEFSRRNFDFKGKNIQTSFFLRSSFSSPESLFFSGDSVSEKKTIFEFKFLPFYKTFKIDGKRPLSYEENGMIPSKGSQFYFSSGFQVRFSFFHIQIQPEFITAQNLAFSGFPSSFSPNVITDRFLYWNVGDSPERYGNSSYHKFFWGQSSISLRFKAFEIGVGTKNFWWGPGQWNSLIFSNNAPGFPHVSLNTFKPAKTFIGSFETQILIGRLESSNFSPTQKFSLNNQYFNTLDKDWRYLNGFVLVYSPMWINGLNFGFARTFQYYNKTKPDDLNGWLPILEPFSKENLFTNGNSVEYDDRAQSQQVAIFGNYKLKKSKAEVYFQFGRRDHSLNWREFFLNPEHARAYQVGFIKLADLPNSNKLLQVRGEITHQQESVNRYIRYDLFGGTSWHTHGLVRGFTNYGQPMGVGIGTGSNVQTLEVSVVEDWNKWGILFERLENNQDFYYRAFGQQGERKPWIDWSTALLWNTSYKDLFISTRLQGTYARNYQWGLSETSTPEFPVSQNLFSLHSQVNLIYFWGRGLKKKE